MKLEDFIDAEFAKKFKAVNLEDKNEEFMYK